MNHFIGTFINQERGILEEEESHHALRVLRLKAGSDISVTNGQGLRYRAEITQTAKHECHFRLKEKLSASKLLPLHIGVAPTKSNDRFEFFLEKATELGVASITPLLCHNSERKQYKQERGERIIRAAVKQSKKAYFPQLLPMVSLENWLKEQYAASRPLFLAHLHGNTVDIFNQQWAENMAMAIGPEGDFSTEEIALAKQYNSSFLSLGTETMRTETAALAAAFWAYGEAQKHKSN